MSNDETSPQRILALALLLLLPAGVGTAQGTPPAPGSSAPRTYVYIRGADTIGTERVTVTDSAYEGMLRMAGGPPIHWRHARQGAALGALRLRGWAPGTDTTATPRQTVTLAIRGDTAYAEASNNGGAPQRQAIPTRLGATPLVNSSMVHGAMLGIRALRAGKVGADLLLSSGGQTIVANVARRPDGMAMAIGAVEFLATIGDDGLPATITVPQQGVRVAIVTGAAPTPKAPAPISYDPPAGAPYVAEHVKITTPAGHALAGTLTRPRGTTKTPVVITISGSGPQDRDSRIAPVPGYAFFAEIADTLARRGVATLRFDDRGVGQSGGAESVAKATTADFADDVRAIVAWLRARPDIDGDRIALVGHSEGGMIAPMVAASDPRLKAIAVLAGPANKGRDILMFQNRQAIAALPQYSAAQRDSILRGVPAQLDSVARGMPWVAYFLDYDPRATARKVTQPVLVLQGETDRQVTAEQADSLAAAFRSGGNTRVTLRRFPRANHLFLDDPSGDPSGYGALKNVKARKDALGALADWLATTLR